MYIATSAAGSSKSQQTDIKISNNYDKLTIFY